MNNFDGFLELQEQLSQVITNIDNVTDILEIGAKEFTDDLLKLPKPISKIKASGYTHLVDSFNYRINRDEVEVGWDKYYGRMVEEGTKISSSKPHLIPTFEKNKDRYYKKMIQKII